MADRVLPGSLTDAACIKEAVCVHTKRIVDGCRDKDCIEDLRVYPCLGSQAYIDKAFSIRPRSAELLHVEVSVDEITFNRCYYTVDVRYFYKVRGDVSPGCWEVTGLAVFDKRVMLFGSEGGTKTFSSSSSACGGGDTVVGDNSLPTAVVEADDIK